MVLRKFFEITPKSAAEIVDVIDLHPREVGRHFGGGIFQPLSKAALKDAGVSTRLLPGAVAILDKDVVGTSAIVSGESPIEIFVLPERRLTLGQAGFAIANVHKRTGILSTEATMVPVSLDAADIDVVPSHLGYTDAVTVAAAAKASYNVANGVVDRVAVGLGETLAFIDNK